MKYDAVLKIKQPQMFVVDQLQQYIFLFIDTYK